MTTGLAILTASLRDIGAIDQDAAPDVAERKVGLEVLAGLFNQLVDGYCEQLYPQAIAASATIGGNVRARVTTAGVTVTLPADPCDGWRAHILNVSGGAITVARNGWKIDLAAANATVADGAELDRFFRADLGGWISPTIAKLSDTVPYPASFDQGLTAMLSILIAPKFELSAQITDTMRSIAGATQGELSRRYGARKPKAA